LTSQGARSFSRLSPAPHAQADFQFERKPDKKKAKGDAAGEWLFDELAPTRLPAGSRGPEAGTRAAAGIVEEEPEDARALQALKEVGLHSEADGRFTLFQLPGVRPPFSLSQPLARNPAEPVEWPGGAPRLSSREWPS
jgi:hypothetical protein